jgi:hypothetical protein
MASNRQIEANRQNARHSTGPKTESGKAKSSGNARRHGLSRSSGHDNDAIEAFTKAVMDSNLFNAPSCDPADIVRAKLELNRIRAVRYELLVALLNAPDPAKAKQLHGLERYERLNFAKQKRAIKSSGNSKRQT